jgi:hypothetical protein
LLDQCFGKRALLAQSRSRGIMINKLRGNRPMVIAADMHVQNGGKMSRISSSHHISFFNAGSVTGYGFQVFGFSVIDLPNNALNIKFLFLPS